MAAIAGSGHKTGDPAWDGIEAAELHARCLRGDEAAWGLVLRRARAICAWHRWGFDPDEREEMAAACVLHLMERVNLVREPRAFKAFIATATRNKILDLLLARGPRVASLDALIAAADDDEGRGRQFAAEGPSSESIVSDRQEMRLLLAALSQLGDVCRITLLRYIEFKDGLIADYKALASTLGTTVGVVSSRVTRCLRRLAEDPELIAAGLKPRLPRRKADGKAEK